MRARTQILLVHDEERPVADLKPLLESQGMDVLEARSCADAETVLTWVEPPVLIFTDTLLSDGSWADVRRLADHLAVPVIVVARFEDLPLYTKVIESGAADFIVPPFNKADLAWVVGSALLNGPGIPTALSCGTTSAGLEVTRHAQNYTRSGAGAANAQAGR